MAETTEDPVEVLKEADRRAGMKPSDAVIPAPADAIDIEYRKAVADRSAEEIGKAIAAASTPEEASEVVKEAGSPVTTKSAKK